MKKKSRMSKRFRGFLPIVMDIETGGFNCETDALLEIAIVTLQLDEQGIISPNETLSWHVLPFPGAILNPESLAVNRIDPYHPFRFAIEEEEALKQLFSFIRLELKKHNCQRAVLVGHNPFFDLSFLQEAVKRCQMNHNPFHSFTTFDTATLAAMAYGETTLVKAVLSSGNAFNHDEAHSAIYDAEKTAELFCKILNRWQEYSKQGHVIL